jgi:hypothetical protein
MSSSLRALEVLVEEEFSIEKISLRVLESNKRAIEFYEKLDYKYVEKTPVCINNNYEDNNSKNTRERIAQCLWKTDEFGEADLNKLKIDSEVATDNDKDEFLEILRTGIVAKDQKSNYN